MPTLDPHAPAVQRAIGQIIIAINGDPAFQERFLADWREALASLEMTAALRQTLIENMASSGLNAFELLTTILTDGALWRAARDAILEPETGPGAYPALQDDDDLTEII